MKRFSPEAYSENGYGMYSDTEYPMARMVSSPTGEYTLVENARHSIKQLTAQVERLKKRLVAAEQDSVRLAWVIENSMVRVQGSDERGWMVLDCSNGLTFLTKEKHKSYNEAIDEAMAIIANRRGVVC